MSKTSYLCKKAEKKRQKILSIKKPSNPGGKLRTKNLIVGIIILFH